MKNRFISFLTMFSLVFSLFICFPQTQFAKDKTDISALAYLLPESNIILAMDMDRALNVVGPSLLSNDEKKIENLKKLAKSAENTIGIDPYQIKQIVVGINFASEKPITFFDNVQTTILLKTRDSNTKLIESWIKNLDEIEAFKTESAPTARYVDELKRLRSYQISKKQEKEARKIAQNSLRK